MEIVRKKVTKLQIIFTLLVFPHINAALECYSTATVNFKISLTISFFFFSPYECSFTHIKWDTHETLFNSPQNNFHCSIVRWLNMFAKIKIDKHAQQLMIDRLL